MLLATRLRIGGSFALAAAVPFALTSAQDGGWTHASDPHAVYGNGKTFFGYVDGSNGNIEVREYVHSTGIVSSPFVLHAALQVDTHAAPAILVMPSGQLVTAYSAHDGATLYVRRSTNAYDVSAWETEQDLDATLGGVDYTYATLFYVGTTLYLFYRDFQGGTTGVLCYATSTSDGVTWSAQTELYKSAGKSSYWKIDSDGSRIDIAVTDGRDPPDAPPTKFYHFYSIAGTRYKSDGTPIVTALPIGPSDLTEVYNGGDGVGWPMDIVTNGTNPVIAYAVLDTPTTNSWRYARWNGSSWVKTAIASSAGVMDGAFASNVVIDHEDIDVTYMPVKVGSHFEIYKYVTPDDGATWSGWALTSGSSVDNMLPSTVRDHAPGLSVVWLKGTYTSYLVFSFGVTGV